MSEHVYDHADGGICMKCDRCRHPDCCDQSVECDGVNWSFFTKETILSLARDLHKERNYKYNG